MIETLDLSRDALHVHIGLAIYLGAALILRRGLGSWLPLLAVVVAALAGEAWDWIDDARRGYEHMVYRHWHDLVNTLMWPAVLFALARFTRVFRR
ncbi:MAG: hypothetical protein H7X93_09250 [Sphingomonadaceae bacterium]|nr:hypothetical protein [Sphingomonadaceae bacterium]